MGLQNFLISQSKKVRITEPDFTVLGNVVIVAGLPGSGKTNYALSLMEYHQNVEWKEKKWKEPRNIYVLNFDLNAEISSLYPGIQVLDFYVQRVFREGELPENLEELKGSRFKAFIEKNKKAIFVSDEEVRKQNMAFPAGYETDEETHPECSPWWEPNSVLFIDEAHDYFGNRRPFKVEPALFLKYLHVIRHKGHTAYFFTQKAKFLDIYVRDMCGDYRYLKRAFGSSHTIIRRYTFFPSSAAEELDSFVTQKYKFREEWFQYYLSTTKDVSKVFIPKMVYVGGFFLIFTIFMVFSLLGTLSDSLEEPQIEEQADRVERPVDRVERRVERPVEKLVNNFSIKELFHIRLDGTAFIGGTSNLVLTYLDYRTCSLRTVTKLKLKYILKNEAIEIVRVRSGFLHLKRFEQHYFLIVQNFDFSFFMKDCLNSKKSKTARPSLDLF